MASDETDRRRARVRELWLKRPDKKVAEILIEDGFGGAAHTADAKRKRLAAMMKNVWNDRVWWRKQWRDKARMTAGDLAETKGEYLANLGSLANEALEMLESSMLKGTPRVQALGELRQLEQAKAKAHGIAETPAVDPEDPGGPRVPFRGVTVALVNLSPEAQKKIDEWNRGGKKRK